MYSVTVFTFPVKSHWKEIANPVLISRSARELVEFVDKCNFKTIIMPRPGCGNGKLKWERVKPLIENQLDNRFIVMTYK